MKTVYKPWGKEIWIELNEHYCYKRIHINQGYKTSFQYHKEKVETNYIIEGTAEIWLENDSGQIEKTIMHAGESFTVLPPKKHRVIAKSDLILQEVSTPQVDDVIRIEDDSNRPSGRLEREHQTPALCILAAGKGTRLGKIGEKIHKGLLPVRNKAVISHMIEKTPQNYDIIIATNYLEDMVTEYCHAAHPDRNFVFIHVEHAEGPGSGPGRSLYECKHLLQRPFIVTTADCIIQDDLPPMDGNWLGLSPTGVPELYSTAKIDENMNILSFKNKSTDGYQFAFIGLCCILDYTIFWQQLEKHLHNGELVDAFSETDKFHMTGKTLQWTDVGTIDNYIKARQDFSLLKSEEFIYKVNNKCIKLFANANIVSGRMCRLSYIRDLVPNVTFKGKHVYAYQWEDGRTLYNIDDYEIMKSFLEWSEAALWCPCEADLSEESKRFYHDKTQQRIDRFISERGDAFLDSALVNNKPCRPISDYLALIDWEELYNTKPTRRFHGDLQFDNVLYNNGKFTLLDWRQSFGNSTECGDAYYDVAKLYGGVLMPYHLMRSEDNFSIDEDSAGIRLEFNTTKSLKKFKHTFEQWAISQGFNMNKVKLLVALIYLNMSPLHPGNFGKLLWYHAQERFYEYFDQQ